MSNDQNDAVKIPVPLPKQFTRTGGCFALSPFVFTDDRFADAARVFCDYAGRLYGAALTFAPAAPLSFVYSADMGTEAYRITSADGRVTVYAADLAGASHGASVLLQLMSVQDGTLTLPAFTACDTPDTEWRGLMIDLARGHYPLCDILTYADLCYFYRMNTLHFHFADGPTYKLPSAHFPKLNENGCYDHAQLRKMDSYCAERGIALLPEIEMPAHTGALITHYPEVFGAPHGDMICPGHPGVFDALDVLIGEVCGLFPNSPYLHIGCDEAPYASWERCPACRAFMKEHDIPGAAALYTYTVDRATRMVLQHGKRPIVWEGFPAEGTENISREVIVMVFQSTYQNADALTKAGFSVINTSW